MFLSARTVTAIITILAFNRICWSNLRCNKGRIQKPSRYYLVSLCHRSQMTVVAKANYQSLKRCETLAMQKKALAFNFSPPTESANVSYDEENPFKSCHVLECPETDITTSLVNDSLFDYYSLYTNPLPTINATCLPGLGVFVINSTQRNYTESLSVCNNTGGRLADISADLGTNGLSDLFSSLKGKAIAAFIGLTDAEQEGRYVTSDGLDLSCTTYRAWAPGHPKKRRGGQDCVALDKQRMWRVMDCAKLLPYICELLPSGPFNTAAYRNTTFPLGCYKNETETTTNKPPEITTTRRPRPRWMNTASPYSERQSILSLKRGVHTWVEQAECSAKKSEGKP